MNIRNNIETTRVVNSKINLSILKDAPGENMGILIKIIKINFKS